MNTRHHQMQDQSASDANLESASVSTFTPIGELADAVILRLSVKLPRVRVKRGRGRHGEENKSPSL